MKFNYKLIFIDWWCFSENRYFEFKILIWKRMDWRTGSITCISDGRPVYVTSINELKRKKEQIELGVKPFFVLS